MIENTTGQPTGILPPRGVVPMQAPLPMAMEIHIEGEVEPPAEEDKENAFNANLAEELDEENPGVLQTLASDLLKDIDNDLQARKDWEEMCKEGLKLMGLKIENRTEPWTGACGVYHPMITEATLKFQSETIMETFPAMGPAKTKIVGRVTPRKEEAAARVAEDMNYQLTEVMIEFRPEHERMLWNLAAAGSAFKKVYMDTALGRQTSIFIPAEDVILPYAYTDMNTCFRVVHRMRKTKQEIIRLQKDGFWRDFDVGDPPKPGGTTNSGSTLQEKKDKEAGVSNIFDERFIVFECLVDLDLEGYEDTNDEGEKTGIALPYVVTILDSTKTILSIRRNWKENDELKLKRQHFVHYVYVPGFGAYGFGLFHLIGGFAKNATSIMRQLVDAGTLSNLPGGLKSRGLRIKGDDTPIGPGEFRDVDLGSGAIKDNIMMLPYKEPSQVLAALLETIVNEGRRMSATADMKISDMSNQAPVGSTLAILERTLKVLTSVQARVHYSFKQELRLIAEIVRDCTPDDYDYDVEAEQGRRAKYDDYRYVEIIPVSDPNAATLSQRVVQYQAVMQMAQTAPQIYDLPELHKRMLIVLGVQHAEKLIPTKDDLKPTDPVAENMQILAGKPVKVFASQDHQAHLQVHMAAQQDPLIMAVIGQNPQAQAILAAMEAHKADHIGYEYRTQMSQMLGIPSPDPYDENAEPISPEAEIQLSRRMAQAAPHLLAKSRAIAAQQQAQKNAQDPVLQAELIDQQVKQGELQRKQRLDQANVALEQQKLQLAARKLEIEAQQKGVDPQTMQLDQAKKQQEIALEAQAAQRKAALETAQATGRMGLEQRKAEEASQIDHARTSADLTARQRQEQRAQEQHNTTLHITRQRAAEQSRQAEEKHKADLKARAQAAARQKAGNTKEKK